MQRKTFGSGIIAFCALLTVGGQAVRADDAKPVTIATSPKVGDSVRYKTILKISANGTDVVVDQNRKHVVKEIKESKDVVLSIEEEGGKVAFGGNDMDIPAGTPTAITVTKMNKILTMIFSLIIC